MVKRLIGALSAIAMIAAVSAADAEEASGTIESIDDANRIIVLDNGVSYSVAEDVFLEGLQPGDEVTVSYSVQGDQNMANEIRLRISI